VDGCLGFRNACRREHLLDDDRADLERVCARSCHYCEGLLLFLRQKNIY
jgi:hypothetical protein